IGPGAVEAIAPLLNLMEQSDERVRSAVFLTLGKMGPDAVGSLGRVRQGLQDQSIEVRAVALEAFAKIETEPERLLPVLGEALRSDREEMRRPAILAMGELGSKARPVATELALLL